jgi:predicted phosphodiesterase
MRLGVIADIHGNLVALETVLGALERERVERLVCLGDVAALGPQPGEVLARLRGLRCPCVMGNTDAWLLGDPAFGSDSPVLAEMTHWCVEQLSDEDRAVVRAFPPVLALALGSGQELLCFHGSPRSFDDVIAATTPEAEIRAMLGGREAAIMVGGHTHVQLLRRYGESVIVNVGSVGLPGTGPGTPDLPVNREVRWAEYGVIDVADGRVSIELRRVPLEMGPMLAAGSASGLPHLDWWLARWDN